MNIETTTNPIAQHFYGLKGDMDHQHQRELYVDDDGNLHHDIDLSEYTPAEQKKIETALREIAERLEAERADVQQAVNSGNIGAQEKEDWEYDAMSARVTQLAAEIESGELEVEAIAQADQVRKTEQSNQTATAKASPQQGVTAFESSSEDVDAATGAADSDDPSAAFEKVITDVEGAAARFDADPKAFFEELKAMSPTERSDAMTAIQRHIQKTNQLMSMITNFQQAMHDTNKAVIANLRV